MSVEELRARLRDEGEEVARGKVRVDSQRALLKLRQRLGSPAAYVLDLVRAAVAAGARHVTIRCDADDLELVHDGRPVTAAALRDLYVHAVGEEHDDEVVWLLASGLNCGMAFKPRWIAVESGTARARLEPPATIDVGEGPDMPGVRLHLKHRVGLAVRRLVSSKDEATALHRFARHVPIELTVNGKRIDRPPLEGEALLAGRSIHAGKLHIVAGLSRGRAAGHGARVTLAVGGVDVVMRELPGLSPHLVAWARHDELKLDASRGDVVDDDPTFQEVIARLRELADELLGAALEQLDAERITVTTIVLAHHRLEAVSKKARALMERAPLLPGPAMEWVSVDELVRGGRGEIRFSRERLDAELYTRPVVLLDPEPQAIALLPAGKRVDIKDEVRARQRREANRRRFEAQPVEEPRLVSGDDVARAPIESRDVRGEVGLYRNGGGSIVRFLREGRLLAEKDVTTLAPLRLHAVVESRRLAPNDAWDDVAEDTGKSVAVLMIRKAARRALLERLEAGGLDGPDADDLRAHALEVLRDLVGNGDPIADTLRRAPLVPLCGGGHISLARLGELDEVRVVNVTFEVPALDGKPVAVLGGVLRATVAGLLHVELRDFHERMLREREIRARIDGPREEPAIRAHVFVRLPIEASGLRGELAVPSVAPEGTNLVVRLLRDGVRLIDREIESRYGAAIAIVDCPALRPTPDWDDVQKNSALRRVFEKVKEAERLLPAALAETFPGIPLDNIPAPARDLIGNFLRVELASDVARLEAQGPARALLETPLFRTLGGPLVSLAQIAALPGRELLTLEPNAWNVQPVPGLTVIIADAGCRQLLGDALGRTCLEAREELPRIARRAEFERLPVREARLAVVGVQKTGMRVEGPAGADGKRPVAFVGEVAHRPGGKPGAEVEVLLGGRSYARLELPGALPTTAIFDVRREIDPAETQLAKNLVKNLGRRIHEAELALVQAAAEEPDRPEARALLLEMLALGVEDQLKSSGTTRALSLPLLPTTSGAGVSVETLAGGEQRIPFVTLPLSARASDDRPVVVAVDPVVRRLLQVRWSRRLDDLTSQMAAQIESRERRRALPQVEAVRVDGDALWRQPITAPGVEGEVALGAFASMVRIHVERRPIALHPIDTPPGVAAAASSDDLVITPSGDVHIDAAYAKLVDAVMRAVDDMAGAIAEGWSGLTAEGRTRLMPAASAVAGWLLERGRAAHPIIDLPLLATTDGSPLSFSRVLLMVRKNGAVRVSHLRGSLADPDEVVWHPRPWERQLAARLDYRLEDAGPLLLAAEEARRRPPVESLAAPLAGPWREPVGAGDGIEGELAIAEVPSGEAILEVIHDGRLLEELRGQHAVGFVARVRCDRLRPTPDGQHVVRDDAYHRVQAAIAVALERILIRLLEAGGTPASAYARAAARWAAATVGPVGQAVAGTALFVDAANAPVTLGRLRAEAAERGRVGIVLPGTPMPRLRPPRLVLAAGEADRKLLDELAIPLEIVMKPAAQAVEREQALAAARLALDGAARRAIVEVPIAHGGWRGRLFLGRVDRSEGVGILYLRDGELLDEVTPGYGISGLLENPDAPIEPDGLGTRLTGAERHRLATMFLDPVYSKLADDAAGLPPELRGLAAHAALRFLALRGVASAHRLDDGGPVGARLASVPLFQTASSRWVDLRTLADHVVRRGPIPVLPEEIDDETGVTLLQPAGDAPRWIDGLSVVLGSDSLRWHATMERWLVTRRDAEPDENSPLYHGLARLRAEAELLRAGAFAKLGAGELARIGLRRAGGSELVVYDPDNAVAMLDPEHPAVNAALVEAAARPDRIYVLLAAVYGVVNRWLERVTDEDEATACAALLEHLAANPAALRSRGR